MTYQEALSYIHSINWTFCKPGLERISTLCEKLGNPQDSLKFIHVAGTNGKGSFCSMLDTVLRDAGYKVGLYTSPNIKEFNERKRFGGQNIADDELTEITELVKPFADEMIDKPTEFELITAIAFEYFKRKGCDVVVLEAGLTGIALEHTEIIGDTVEKIAAEKAGIIKNGVPVMYGGTDDVANEVISKKAHEMGCAYTRVDRSTLKIHKSDLDGTKFSFGSHENMEISLLGTYQTQNASNVLTAIDILRENGFAIDENAVKSGLKSAKWCARFEIINKDPLVIYDGAHNPNGVRALCEALDRARDSSLCVVFACMRDKEIADSLFISKRTVDAHRANILEKTGSKNTASLVVYAIKHQLVEI